MGSSCLLNGTCQRNNNETGFKEETRSICAVFCEVEPNEHVSEPGGIEGPPKLPARFGGPILRYQLQRTLTLSRGKAAALLKNNSCTSYGFMEQAASVPCCRWDPCQSMPYWEHASGGVHLVRVKHSHHHVRPEVCLMCFVPSVTEDSWDIVPSAMCFVLLNIGTAPSGPGGRGDHMISEGQALKASKSRMNVDCSFQRI